ncbi:hypothetical protein, partial [Salmonella enterica]|uniref:hypothetical protein n=1 Tax=Salmonella enterica TaxID=28901 RepID=UPI0019D5C1C6
VTLPNIYVLQQPGYAHDLSQADYSEMIVLMSRTCTLDGQESTVEAVLSDPSLAGLISHEGVIKVPGMRQPGVT